MDNKIIAAKMGYKNVSSMFSASGYSAVLFHKLKPESKKLKINDKFKEKLISCGL